MLWTKCITLANRVCMWGNEWLLKTPAGDYRLVQNRCPKIPAATEGSNQLQELFFAEFQLRQRDPGALRAVLRMLREEGSRLCLAPDQDPCAINSSQIGQLVDWLRQGLRSGRIAFELQAPVRTRAVHRFLAPPKPERPEPRPKTEPQETWFELTVLDEMLEPVSGIPMVLTQGSSRYPQTTDGAGRIRITVSESSSFAGIAATAAGVEAATEVLKGRWGRVRGERPKLPKPSDGVTQIPFRGKSLPSVSLTAQTPHQIILVPEVQLLRLQGLYFDTNKCFLLPAAIPALKRMVQLYQFDKDYDLLIAGHTDTSGDPAYNLDLSLERAEAMKAFLLDGVEHWLAWYESGRPREKRWGSGEDWAMLRALGPTRGNETAQIRGYQELHNAPSAAEKPRHPLWEPLKMDGLLGPATRKQLILDYMQSAGTSLPPGTDVTTLGCGEGFSLNAQGDAPDEFAEDGVERQDDRRVELFYFPKAIGIQPPPPGNQAPAGSQEYLEWCRRAQLEEHQAYDKPANRVVSLVVLSNSGNVVLANRPYQLLVDGGPTLEGTTDAEGFLEHDGLPAGDHVLVMEGFRSRVGATPAEYRRRRHMFAGYTMTPKRSS